MCLLLGVIADPRARQVCNTQPLVDPTLKFTTRKYMTFTLIPDQILWHI